MHDIRMTTLINAEKKHIEEQLYLLQKGVRECCLIDVPNQIWNETKEQRLKDFKYFIYSNEYKVISLFIYTRDHQLELFKKHYLYYYQTNNLDQKTITDEYILGKLLNYSEQSMQEFLKKNYKL